MSHGVVSSQQGAALEQVLEFVFDFLRHGEVRQVCSLVCKSWRDFISASGGRCLNNPCVVRNPFLDFVLENINEHGHCWPLCLYSDDYYIEDEVQDGDVWQDAKDVVILNYPLPLFVGQEGIAIRVLRLTGEIFTFEADIEMNETTAKECGIDNLLVLEKGSDLGYIPLEILPELEPLREPAIPHAVVGETGVSSSNQVVRLVTLTFQARKIFGQEYPWGRNLSWSSTRHESTWNFHQEKEGNLDGVLIADNDVPGTLQRDIVKGIDALASRPVRDFHPGSENKVVDHVHPGLFAFVRGESHFFPSKDLDEPFAKLSNPRPPSSDDEDENKDEDISEILKQFMNRQEVETDRWGRPYESSKYQWLPTYFDVSNRGVVSIRGDINNLRPRTAYAQLYDSLAMVFELFLPELSTILLYANKICLPGEDPDEYDSSGDPFEGLHFSSPARKLYGSSFQVITKIVDYELQPGQRHEGVWHVEGMSHEHIVATCLYIVDRDEHVIGGDLLFKRAFTEQERGHIFWNVGQDRDEVTEIYLQDGITPVGCVPTVKGRRLCWPNSHIHKVSEMLNTGHTIGRRRIIAFFVVDPFVRIPSTQEVPDQTSSMGLTKALEHRLLLMQERKFHKQDFNVRNLNLCEH